MQLFAHFARYPWRVPLYCLPVALTGAALEIAYLFKDLGTFVLAILGLLGAVLVLGLAGYGIAIRSLAKNAKVSGVQVFLMVVLCIGHLLGTIWYWYVVLAMKDALPH